MHVLRKLQILSIWLLILIIPYKCYANSCKYNYRLYLLHRCYVNSCQQATNSSFKFWNSLFFKYFWSSVGGRPADSEGCLYLPNWIKLVRESQQCKSVRWTSVFSEPISMTVQDSTTVGILCVCVCVCFQYWNRFFSLLAGQTLPLAHI